MKMNQETNFFTVREGKGENKLFCNTLWCLFNLHFRKAIVQYGMFHQVQVDGGIELYLSLFIQEEYQHLRDNASHIAPYRQIQSKHVCIGMYTQM